MKTAEEKMRLLNKYIRVESGKASLDSFMHSRDGDWMGNALANERYTVYCELVKFLNEVDTL